MKKILVLLLVILLVGCVEVDKEYEYTLLIHQQSICNEEECTHTFIDYYSEEEIIITNDKIYNGEFYLWIDKTTVVDLKQRSD